MPKTKRLTQVRAGRLVSAVLYTQATAWDEPAQRAAKSKISSAARQRLNHKASWQKLEAVLAANFDRDDLFVTLTYRDEDLPATREAALRCLNTFLAQLRAARRVRGEAVLYVKNAEHLTDDGSEGRWHHHVVINATGADYEEIRSLWARWGDNVDFEPLLSDGMDFAARAQYLCKERPPVGKQAWTPSRGLRRPERTSELVDDALTLSAPAGAIIIDRDEKVNAWGSYVYIKYLLPWRPRRGPRLKRRRPPDAPRRAPGDLSF
ncbi:MAG: hypothetical protein IJF88_02610 [Oscillospiraceae bacterium]|nr:hypothetical protein [Oscillospiraceae bacterium]